MSEFTYEILNPAHKNDRTRHEKNLYLAFFKTYPWYADQFFRLIDQNRLQPKMDYQYQKIYTVKKNREIMSAISVCIDPGQSFELEEMGFKIKKTAHCCEGLHFYGNLARQFFLGWEDLYQELGRFMLADLQRLKFNQIYSTCSKRLLRLYRYIGFHVVDQLKVANDELEFLILKDF